MALHALVVLEATDAAFETIFGNAFFGDVRVRIDGIGTRREPGKQSLELHVGQTEERHLHLQPRPHLLRFQQEFVHVLTLQTPADTVERRGYHVLALEEFRDMPIYLVQAVAAVAVQARRHPTHFPQRLRRRGGTDKKIISMEGNKCEKSDEFVRQELIEPMRILTTTARIQGSSWPVIPVRTDKPVPKRLFPRIMKQLRRVKLQAPVNMLDVVVKDVLHTGADMMVTRTMPRE